MLENALFPILVTLTGIYIFVSVEQALKALFPIVSVLAGITTLPVARPLQATSFADVSDRIRNSQGNNFVAT